MKYDRLNQEYVDHQNNSQKVQDDYEQQINQIQNEHQNFILQKDEKIQALQHRL